MEGSKPATLRGRVHWDRDIACLFILLRPVRFFLFLFTSYRFVFLTKATPSYMKRSLLSTKALPSETVQHGGASACTGLGSEAVPPPRAVIAEVSSPGVHVLCDSWTPEWLPTGHLGDRVDCGLHLADLLVLGCFFCTWVDILLQSHCKMTSFHLSLVKFYPHLSLGYLLGFPSRCYCTTASLSGTMASSGTEKCNYSQGIRKRLIPH